MCLSINVLLFTEMSPVLITTTNTFFNYDNKQYMHISYIIYIDTNKNCSNNNQYFHKPSVEGENSALKRVLLGRKKAPAFRRETLYKKQGPRRTASFKLAAHVLDLILPHEIMPLPISRGEFFYSVLRLLNQFTRPKPIPLKKMAPGAGITSAMPST
jgi:hypothetical protein